MKSKPRVLKGQSLIEIVFAIGIIALVLTAIVSLSVRSVGVTSSSANQTRANRYAEEAIEWFRIQRDANPQSFFTTASNPSTRTMCFNIIPASSSWPAAGNCGASSFIQENGTNTNFKRTVNTVYNSATAQLDITVTVTWGNSSVVHKSSLTDPRAR